jgi:hypothetical protein
LQREHQRLVRLAAKGLSADERSQLVSLLQRLEENLEQGRFEKCHGHPLRYVLVGRTLVGWRMDTRGNAE